ncbi:DNA-binding transcriptional MerR regulator [Cryobacterium mesophilum]|uniref:MerR family transcriptional regulator n=1 Tax=Terrimesophilobacter mesophilus TaxID=433647 RepID=A0A4R8V7R5_9MICO|nr:MerR family transcriptional regulator [Terrimesophilobacter mesophilus]MBB5632329.1 DNA-binding transcriptional MerR regulator [Terrimesophilobacter mesophilus]TFB79171.1 MerR family transcriptional regulator [Terrimesophilobacter mesophilus]
MKISELCRRADVAATTLKYYIREGLVAEGLRSAPNRTDYDEDHVHRIRLVRALIETGGLSIASARHVLAVIDAEGTDLAFAFEAIQNALGATGRAGERSASTKAQERVMALVNGSGWAVTPGNPGIELAARALDGLSTIGFTPSDEFLAGYATACLGIAQADLGALTTRDSPELVLELMVVGTVMGDVLMSGLRRLAQESTAATVFPVSGRNSNEKREQ